MNPSLETVQQTAAYPWLATGAWFAAACAALAAWLWLHRVGLRASSPRRRAAAIVARAAVGFILAWLVLQTLAGAVTFGSDWPLWAAALLAAAAAELIVALYLAEAETVGAAARRWLLALRLALAGLVLLLLLQPALTLERQVRQDRFVAVLLDGSQSMQLADPQSTPAEKLRLARLYDLPWAKSSPSLEAVVEDIERLRRELQQHATVLSGLASSDPQAQPPQLAAQRSAGPVDRKRQGGNRRTRCDVATSAGRPHPSRFSRWKNAHRVTAAARSLGQRATAAVGERFSVAGKFASGDARRGLESGDRGFGSTRRAARTVADRDGSSAARIALGGGSARAGARRSA